MGRSNKKQQRATVSIMPEPVPSRVRYTNSVKRNLQRNKKQYLIILLLLFVTLIAGLTVYRLKNSSQVTETKIENETTVIANEYQKLLSQGPPKTSVPADVIAYYESLATRAADTKNYQEAIKAFEQRSLFSPKSMDYLDYFTGGKYYCMAGDKVKADEALDKSISLFPAQDDYDNGFYRDRMLMEIEYLRKECGL